jgi:DHA1 family bicyclomycin/chloramphenicol resistance-like MFS transporter
VSTLQHQTAVRWPTLIVLASLAAVAPVSTDLYLPGFPELGDDLDASASAVQLTLTAFLVGLAVGQLVMGPLSDRYGRRTPLIASTAVCVVAGVVCALAPTLPVLVGGRLVQGLAGAGGMVIGRAVLADLVTGTAAARAFTLMLTVGGVAPVLAPLVGGLLADAVGWRGMLWTVAGLCAAMLVGVVVVLRETHPVEARTASETSYADGLRVVARTRGYWPPVATMALSFAMMMAYISASPFVYQNVIGLSAVAYGVAFGINAVGLISAGWVSARMVERFEPRRIVRFCVSVQVVATLTFVVLAAVDAPSWLLPVPIFVAVTTNGGVMGNSAAAAMSQVREVAGSGSAVLGFTQFALGALVSPLVGLGGEDSAVVPAVVMAGASCLALLVSRAGPRGGSPRRAADRAATRLPDPSPAEGASGPPR